MSLYLILCLVLVVLIAVAPIHAQETVVWQIGQFDGDYEEFAIAHNEAGYPAAFPNDVAFVAGKDDSAKSWSFIHPGPADAWAGSRTHPFTVVFNLPDEPKGAYRLRIDLVNTHSIFPPVYEIRVNDEADRLDLPRGHNDDALTDASKGRKHQMNLGIPSSLLRKGENKIALTTVSGSHFIYDALSLTNEADTAAVTPAIGNVTVSPTIRFVRTGGKLKRIAQMTAQISYANDEPVATIAYDGKTQTVRLKPRLFGSVSTDIHIDDLPEPAPLEVTVRCGDQSKTATCEVKPEKHWKVYVMPTAHVDVGYTDLQERVKVRHNENTSLAVELCREYPDFKWNTEVGWAQDIYLSMMPDESREQFIQLAREGRMGCQVIYGNMLTGTLSHEQLIRSLYYTKSMANKHGIPWDMAVSTDVPTQVWTLPSVLAGSGIRYFAAGLNTVRANSATRLFNKPFYWQGPDGASVLTWLSPGYAGAQNLGLADTVERAKGTVDGFIAGFRRADYPYDAVFSHGAFADNVPLNARVGAVINEWNRTYAYPQIILCRGPEFFSYVEKNFSQHIPTIAGDAGVYWEDGVGSTAYETGINRVAKEELVTAEKLFSLATALGGSDYPHAALNAAWKDALLYDEHTWGAAGSISDPRSEQTVKQWAYKSRFAKNAARAAAELKEQAFDDLAGLVKVDELSVVVFNPLNWPVSDIVRAESPDGSILEFIAEAPAMGFSVYPISRISAISQEEDNALENRFYRVEFDATTGAVKRLYDKELGRELVDSSARYGINQYVYMSGLGDDMKDATRTAQTGPATLFKETRPGCQVMRVQVRDLNNASLDAEVVLYDNQKRIDFLNTLDKTLTYDREGGYFAFPFGLGDKPQFHVDLPNGTVNPNKDMLPGACMAWYCAQDYVAASDDKVSVTWAAVDSPLLTLCDVNYETADGWPTPKAALKWPSALDNGHVYGYAFNNYWFTNYKAGQGGRLQFRFALTSSSAYDPTEASRFGQSVRNPLLAKVVQPVSVSGTNSRNTIPITVPLCSVSPSGVVIQTIKQAESGEGIIIRLRELSGKDTKAVVTVPAGLKSAWKCNLVEDRQSRLSVSKGRVTVDLKANGLATLLLK